MLMSMICFFSTTLFLLHAVNRSGTAMAKMSKTFKYFFICCTFIFSFFSVFIEGVTIYDSCFPVKVLFDLPPAVRGSFEKPPLNPAKLLFIIFWATGKRKYFPFPA
jgi:hypothetical protein